MPPVRGSASRQEPPKLTIFCGEPPTDDPYDDITEEEYAPTPRTGAPDQIPFLCLQYGAGGKAAIETRTTALCQMIIEAKQTIQNLTAKARQMCSLYKINPLTIAASIYPQIYNPIEHDTLIRDAAKRVRADSAEAAVADPPAARKATAEPYTVGMGMLPMAEDLATIRIGYLTAEKNKIKCATELNILQLLHVNAQSELYLYQILDTNINTIVGAANGLLQNQGAGLRSAIAAIDLGIDTFSYIAETCATVLETLSHHPIVTAWKTQIDGVLEKNKDAVLCKNIDGVVQLSSLNPASGQKVLYDAESINETLRKCAKFSVNRVLFEHDDGMSTPKNQQFTAAQNRLRGNRFALTAGHPSFKISLSGGNFVAIKAARHWLGNQSPDVFEMANKVSDLDLKFVCIDPMIVNAAVVMHSRGARGFGLCRIKVNTGEFIDLSIPLFSQNPVLALILHNAEDDMIKTIAELQYIVDNFPTDPKTPKRGVRLGFLRSIAGDAFNASANALLERAQQQAAEQQDPAQAAQAAVQLLQAVEAQAAPPEEGAGSMGGGKKRTKKRTKKNKKKKTKKRTKKNKRTNKKNKRSKRKKKRSNK